MTVAAHFVHPKYVWESHGSAKVALPQTPVSTKSNTAEGVCGAAGWSVPGLACSQRKKKIALEGEAKVLG